MTEPQTRNMRPAPTGKESTPVGRQLVAVIGINQYVHLPALSNAVSDATGIRRLFVEKLGFTVVAELFDRHLADPGLLPPDWRASIGAPGDARTARVIADYIAGMTDNFAFDTQARLQRPQSRHIPGL